ncbi:FtsX-like permease family protein [Melioribacter sp. OK-6-Me]|uniref:FtsX-like permease family protein n=1 Tax=Melioribacter sp. OK-6-Me TaxID=3423433 RepID=UPI003ED8CEB7
MIEYFIAKRYLKAKHKFNLITIISTLSVGGITIGVAALIIVLSVFNGFGSLVKSILISFDPHLRIVVTGDEANKKINDFYSYLRSNSKVKNYFPYVESKVIAYNKKSYEIINLKGIPAENDAENWGLKEKIISGKYDLSNEGLGKIIIGLPLSLRLSLRVGDTVTITSARNIERMITSLSIPHSQKFIVSGLFETNNRDYDVSYAFSSIEEAKRLLGYGDEISGIEVRLENIEHSEKLKKELTTKFGDDYFSYYTWYDLHKDLYSIMSVERWSAYILLSLIIAVATFNIFASLTMTVLEKKKDIAILRSMGADSNRIRRIFMYEGLMVGIIGTVAGIILGLTVCYLQINYNFYPLDPTKYIINAMPVKVMFTDIIAIGSMSLLLTFLASIYPAKRASKTNIIESIKYE